MFTYELTLNRDDDDIHKDWTDDIPYEMTKLSNNDREVLRKWLIENTEEVKKFPEFNWNREF